MKKGWTKYTKYAPMYKSVSHINTNYICSRLKKPKKSKFSKFSFLKTIVAQSLITELMDLIDNS